jgi:hypothetical protein
LGSAAKGLGFQDSIEEKKNAFSQATRITGKKPVLQVDKPVLQVYTTH